MSDTGRNGYGSTSGSGQNEDSKRHAKEQAYAEYLSLRENRSSRGSYVKDDDLYGEYFSNRGSGSKERKHSIEDTPYGRSEMRSRSNKRASEQSAREQYLSEREKSGQAIARQGRKNRVDSEKLSRSEKRQQKKNAKYGGAGGGGGKKKKRSPLKIALIVLIVLVLAVGGIIAAGLTVIKNTLDNIGEVEIDLDAIGINEEVDAELSNYRNIAILGIDSRDMSSDEDTRSDAIIIASINKETNEIKMFSVYRDTMLYLGDEIGLDKITHAYYYGGATQVLYTLNKNLDLNIKEVVVVNWKSVADLVDAIGGIDIEIQESEINEMNKYIDDTYNSTGGSDEKIESAGTQTLNGVQAVTYARIRKDALTGDYRRNERMKIVVQAVFEKAKGMKLSSLRTIANDILPEVKTNLNIIDIMSMMMDITSYEMTTSVGWPYDVGEWTGNAFYGPPVTLKSNVIELHEEFFDQEDYSPTQDVLSISEQISYKTGLY